MTNVINESISATTSINVRTTLNVNRQPGKFISSFAPYGYRKDPDDHHKLPIAEDAASIVRMIFEKYIGGESIIGIAKDLNEMGIPNPTTYIAHFKKYENIDCLTRPMLTKLIESIRVHEGGRIEIDLKYRDAFEQVIEYIEINKDAAIEVA